MFGRPAPYRVVLVLQRAELLVQATAAASKPAQPRVRIAPRAVFITFHVVALNFKVAPEVEWRTGRGRL